MVAPLCVWSVQGTIRGLWCASGPSGCATENWAMDACEKRVFTYAVLISQSGNGVSDVVTDVLPARREKS